MDYSDFSLSSEKLRRDIFTRLMKTNDVSNDARDKEFPPSFLILQKKFLRSCPHRPYSCKIVRDFVLSLYRITHLEIAELLHQEIAIHQVSGSLMRDLCLTGGQDFGQF